MDAATSRSTLAGFVSTSVLTSSDGLFGDNVEEQRIADTPAPKESSGNDYKPLYERLQENKERKDNEWKEKNNPFAPPKALDDEEIEFIRTLEEKQATNEAQKKAQHEQDLAKFLMARESAQKPTTTAATPSIQTAKYLKPQEQEKPAIVIRAKTKRKADEVKPKPVKQAKTNVTATVSSGLVAYGSSSEADDE